MKKWKVSLLFLLALILTVMTGCQSVGGVDLNKVLTENMTLTSYEGNADFRLKLLVDENAELTAEEAQMVEWVNSFAVVFDEIKVQDPMTMSMEGKVEVLGETIPFTLTMAENDMAILIEGAKKPIVIPSTYNDGTLPADLVELQQIFSGEAFNQDMLELTQVLGGFIIKHFPNPETVTVEDVSETVQGNELALKKVHIELNGEELLQLVKGLLSGILADEEGLKETLGALHEIMVPIITEVMGVVADEADQTAMEGIKPYLENKELAVEFLYTMIQTNLAPFVENYDTYVQSLLSMPGVQEIFSKENVLSTDIYVDEAGLIWKQTVELSIMPGLVDENIKGFHMYSTSEMWNHGGDVTARLLDTSDALILNDQVTEEDLENLFDPDSIIYQWIKQLEALTLITEEEIIVVEEMDMDIVILDLSGATSLPGYEQQPYIEQGVTMVPVRYVSEELKAEVEWNAETKQVTVTDLGTDQQIVLTVDSTLAEVNGEEVTLDLPAVVRDGRVFVPLRFIAESLGGEVFWDEETKTVTIIKY